MESCAFKEKIECHSYTDCTMSASCNGRMATCPQPVWQKNFKPCNKDTKVCILLDSLYRAAIYTSNNYLYAKIMFHINMEVRLPFSK